MANERIDEQWKQFYLEEGLKQKFEYREKVVKCALGDGNSILASREIEDLNRTYSHVERFSKDSELVETYRLRLRGLVKGVGRLRAESMSVQGKDEDGNWEEEQDMDGGAHLWKTAETRRY